MSHGSRLRVERALWIALPAALVGLGFAQVGGGGSPSPATPTEVVKTYETLADAILAVKKTEEHLVWSFLAAGLAHAQKEVEGAQAAAKAGDAKKAKGMAENAAALVAQLANEGDNSVARVRKKLLEGGHHHNAEGEAKGIYDEGYVVVTKAAKKSLLDASKAIAQLAAAPDADALGKQWAAVSAAYEGLKKKQ